MSCIEKDEIEDAETYIKERIKILNEMRDYSFDINDRDSYRLASVAIDELKEVIKRMGPKK